MRSRSEGRSAAAAVDRWTRKLHYYLGLYFLSSLWLFSLSGLLLNHPGWTFAEFWPQRKQLKSERPVRLRTDLPDLERARDVMAQLGIRGEVECGVPEPPAGHFTFRASRPGNIIEVDADTARDRAVVNETVLNGWGILHVLHLFSGARGDDGLKSRNWFLTSVWTFSMDALAAGLLFMLASGIYVWYRSGRRRVAGAIILALAVGCLLGAPLWSQETGPAGAKVDSRPPAERRRDLCSLEGRAVNALSGEAVRRVSLTLRHARGRTGPVTAVTDAEGRFLFERVEPGSYILSAERAGFLRTEYGARSAASAGVPLSFSAGQQLRDLEFKLTPQGVITGKVLDEDGEPLAGVEVAAFRQRAFGTRRRIVETVGEITNDVGEFRISELDPGSYLLAADRPEVRRQADAARPPSAQPEEAYVPTFYPGAADPAGAAPVEVTAGQEVSGINIQLRKAAVYHLRGRVAGPPAAQSGGNLSLTLIERERDGVKLRSGRVTARISPDGAFEIAGVAAGSYTLAITASGSHQVLGRLPVEVTGSNLEDLVVPVGDSLVVTGSVRMEGRQRANLRGVGVSFLPADGAPFARLVAPVKEDGSFRLEGMSRDQYRLSIHGLPEEAYIRSVRAGGQEVLDRGLDLTQAASGPVVEITLSPRAGTVGGLVRSGQEPAPGSLVTLIPQPLRPEAPHLLRTASADQHGRFLIGGVAPGEYRLYAWEDAEVERFLEPEFLKGFEGKGAPITVREGERQMLELQPLKMAGGSSQ